MTGRARAGPAAQPGPEIYRTAANGASRSGEAVSGRTRLDGRGASLATPWSARVTDGVLGEGKMADEGGACGDSRLTTRDRRGARPRPQRSPREPPRSTGGAERASRRPRWRGPSATGRGAWCPATRRARDPTSRLREEGQALTLRKGVSTPSAVEDEKSATVERRSRDHRRQVG